MIRFVPKLSRCFSSYGLLQKTLIQKIQSSSKDQTFLTLNESTKFFNKWLLTDQKKLINEYEEMILSRVELPDSVNVRREKVAGLNTLSFNNSKSTEIDVPTVLIHGHCSSGIFYHRNFNELSKNIKDLYTLDLPDVGLSDSFPAICLSNGKKITKPKFDFKLNEKTGEYKIKQNIENFEKVSKVKDYYINAIEEWRISKKLDKINLIGHSFGGYLSFFYSLKYPNKINKLVLVSPAGVERSLFSLKNNNLKSLDDYKFGLINNNDITSLDYYRNAFIPWIISTFGFYLTKSLGPLGVQLIAKYLSLRYERGVVFYNSKARESIEQDDKVNSELVKIFVKYTILLFYQNQKSYFYLQCLLNNQILAYDPIIDHLNEFKNPISLLYGEFDWMDSNAGLILSDEYENNYSDCTVIKNAGHNVFLDNSDEFNTSVLEFLKG